MKLARGETVVYKTEHYECSITRHWLWGYTTTWQGHAQDWLVKRYAVRYHEKVDRVLVDMYEKGVFG